MTEKSDINITMYTPPRYTVTFQPNTVGGHTPDRITFKNVTNLIISMDSTGQQCQIREGGGKPSRRRRTEQRIMNNGLVKKEKEDPKEEKDKKEDAINNNNDKKDTLEKDAQHEMRLQLRAEHHIKHKTSYKEICSLKVP